MQGFDKGFSWLVLFVQMFYLRLITNKQLNKNVVVAFFCSLRFVSRLKQL